MQILDLHYRNIRDILFGGKSKGQDNIFYTILTLISFSVWFSLDTQLDGKMSFWKPFTNCWKYHHITLITFHLDTDTIKINIKYIKNVSVSYICLLQCKYQVCIQINKYTAHYLALSGNYSFNFVFGKEQFPPNCCSLF